MGSRHAARRTVTALLLASCVLTACATAGPAVTPTSRTSDTSVPATSAPASTPTFTPAIPDAAPVEPLTGRPLADPALLTRPAVVVKVSDVPEAYPQVGLNDADLVFVEPNGVAYTRLAAVFHSTLPGRVGPVRSLRPADVPLFSPMHATLASSMAAEWVMNYVNDSPDLQSLGTLQVPRSSGVYTIDRTRRSPNHVFAHPDAVAGLARHTGAPAPYFTWAPSAATASTSTGTPARRLDVSYGVSGQPFRVRWDFDAATGRYQRQVPWGRHVLADGSRVSADTVLVIECHWELGKIFRGRGAPDPVLSLIDGRGAFVAASGGRVVRGTWTKGAASDLFELTTDDGLPLALAPGRTWVELPKEGADVRVEG